MERGVVLRPLHDVEQRGERFYAVSSDPWLAIDEPFVAQVKGQFIEVAYRSSFWDEPVRPVFRFHLSDGTTVECLAPGPVAGTGSWTGRVPAGAVRASVSPTSRQGLFGFRIDAVRRRGWIALVIRGLTLNRRSARSALLTRLIGWRQESDINLAWAIGSRDLTAYARWHQARARPIDLSGLDAPRFAWSSARPIRLYIDARSGAEGLRATLATLNEQVFPYWTACVLTDDAALSPSDPRVTAWRKAEPRNEGEIVGWLRAGDCLKPYALAVVAEAVHRYPSCRLIYGDEERRTPTGITPVFKPGWSPVLQAQQKTFGGAVFVRRSVLQSEEDVDVFVRDGLLPRSLLEHGDRHAIVSTRRVLVTTDDSPHQQTMGPVPPLPPDTSVAIIIPTRDQPARLRQLLASIDHHGGSLTPEIIIVDNGSVLPEAKHLSEQLRQRSDLRVIDRPGPFNFSQMCNDGAEAAGSVDVLVFLNDDTEALSAQWLERLASWALQRAVGAVGARLTYPDGRLQHVGVVLGMGGSAGHFGAFATGDAPGWNGRNGSVHEVSAVTGACLAVCREKFEQVGGFDAANLPVELSDLDLCLKLAEQGWTSLVDPQVHLRHDESASRGGATFRRAAVYEKQRAYFQRRWLQRLRDDPYFHPGLSLFNWKVSLA